MWKRNRHFKKQVKTAHYLIGLGWKVYNYRRDILTPQQGEALVKAIETVKEHLTKVADAERAKELEAANAHLQNELKQCGGTLYPRTFLAENVEMLLVAAILAIGIRTFFLQPFKIPTNSMYPTYNGMTSEIFTPEHPRPGPVVGALRKVGLWAQSYQLKAPADGELKLPVRISRNEAGIIGQLAFQPVPGRTLGIAPTTRFRYTFQVGDQFVSLEVPQDFALDSTLIKTLFPEYTNLGDLLSDSYQEGRLQQQANGNYWLLATGKYFEKGQDLLDFDLLTGDMLFVDRCSYHFRPPKVGEPIVFRTGEIPNVGTDKYYIKRLAALDGDTLEIREPVLYRNGQPITGADAFTQNAQQAGDYAGYENRGRLAEGLSDTIPEGYGYALGDNSPSSSDSRIWGYVPQESMLGRALFIYYPFSHRWGAAQ